MDPDSSAARAAATLGGQARADALRLARVPTATWLTDGTPEQVRAGVARADGFLLNASDHQPTRSLTACGTWLPQCVDLATGGVGSTTARCPRRPADGRTDDPSAQLLTSAARARARPPAPPAPWWTLGCG